MNLVSVTGKNWILKKFNDNDVKKFTDEYALSEITAKLLSIRKKKHRQYRSFFKSHYKKFTP